MRVVARERERTLNKDERERRYELAMDAAHKLTLTPWYRPIKRGRLLNVVAFQTAVLHRDDER